MNLLLSERSGMNSSTCCSSTGGFDVCECPTLLTALHTLNANIIDKVGPAAVGQSGCKTKARLSRCCHLNTLISHLALESLRPCY